jgi:hypothetical protein
LSVLQDAKIDIASVTRASDITLAAEPEPGLDPSHADQRISIKIPSGVPTG